MENWRELACQTGISPVAVATVAASLPEADVLHAWSFEELLEYHTKFLLGHPGMLFGLVDPGSSDLIRIMPRRSKKRRDGRIEYTEDVPTWERRWQDTLRGVLPQWLSGTPLNAIGEGLHRHRGAKGRVKAVKLGRRFALQTASALGHGVSLVDRVIEQRNRDQASEILLSWLRIMAGCVREGFDDPDKLLLFWYLRRYAGLYPRVKVHKVFDDMVRGQLPTWQHLPGIDARRSAIRDLVRKVAP